MARRTASPSLLPLLRSQTQAGILERLLLRPDETFTVAGLASELSVTSMSVRRELERMLRAGIAEREWVGRQSLFRASVASPIYEPLRQLIERSVGLEALLRAALDEVDGIDAAVIFGSWARGEVDAHSDVDVLVVGDFVYTDALTALRDLEDRAGREINVVAMRAEELRSRAADGDGFVRDIIDSPMRTLVGELSID